MSAADIPKDLRTKDRFHHIDPGFVNWRLCITALPQEDRRFLGEHLISVDGDQRAKVINDHKLVTVLLDFCEDRRVPSLLKALTLRQPHYIFRSTERLAPCPEIYDATRVSHAVELDMDFEKPVVIAYHTNHIVADTRKLALAEGALKGYVNAIVGLLHNKPDRFEIEPLVIGAPWFEHRRNGKDGDTLSLYHKDFGEILPEDIDQFSKMRGVQVESAEEWMKIMRKLPEAKIKEAFAGLLSDPTKKDWGGELNDHFSASVSVGDQRRTAAFMLKGPSQFREMTLSMCGINADQIHRLVDTGADLSIVQHSHQIGHIVRRTLHNEVAVPGNSRRKYCLIDGKATYRILKAYSLL